jgi:hypothetical protein
VADQITLSVPREKPFYRVAHLVLGGLAVRLDLTFDTLEDLQVALAGLLSREEDGEGEVTVAVRVLPDALKAVIGPFQTAAIHREWESDADFGLRRILQTVCDDVQITQGEGGNFVELTKSLRTVTA